MIKNMEFSEQQLQEILALKERLSQQIEKYKEEIESLEKNVQILNLILKQKSFVKASKLESRTDQANEGYTIPITKSGGELIIAKAKVTSDKVSIVLDEKFDLNADTPPFQSFFINRIIGGMKKKDLEDLQSGNISKDSIIDCVVNKNGTLIREIVIKNYKQKERVNEIINTASWSLSRMIENSR